MYLEELKCKKLELLTEFNKIQDIRKKDEELTKLVPTLNISLISLIYLLVYLNTQIDLGLMFLTIPVTYALSIPIVSGALKSINHLSNGYTKCKLNNIEKTLAKDINKCNEEINKINYKRDSIKETNIYNNDINLNKNKVRVLKRVKK